MSTIKIGFLVSKDYADFYRIQSQIHDLKVKFGETVEIVQIADNYYRKEIKDFALSQLGLEYSEILRYDKPYNSHSNQNEYKFGKKTSPKWYYTRNYEFIQGCDGIFAFTRNLTEREDVSEIIQLAQKHSKKILIFS